MATNLLSDLLNTPGLKIECPKCQEIFPAKRGRLFDATAPLPLAATRLLDERRQALVDGRLALQSRRKAARERPMIAAKSVRIGKVVEKIAAALPGFPSQCSDCRSLFEPIDYIVFKGLSQSRIEFVDFVEVKSGASTLTAGQRQIKEAVEHGRVSLLLTDLLS
jgi:predicted Holliday junction resolvase-like endonuclease